MTEIKDKDMQRLKELLQRSSEFIAYFEIVETKMMEWRQSIEEKADLQRQQYQQHSQSLQYELEELHNILSQTSTKAFQQSMSQALAQGEQQLQLLHEKGEQLTLHLNQQLEKFEQLSHQSLEQLNSKFSQYDIGQFHRIADESCSHIDLFVQKAIKKTHFFFKTFQWKIVFLTVLTSIVTSFVIGLYVSDETPWETHQQAINERQAGRLLLTAWSALSQQEKIKILKHEAKQNG